MDKSLSYKFIPSRGKYHCGTDCYVDVIRVYHVSDKGYVKLKAKMVNKRNGIVYPLKFGTWGMASTIKLQLKDIQHWERYYEDC